MSPGLLLAVSLIAQAPPVPPATPTRDHNADILMKALSIQKAYAQLGDIAEVGEIRYTSAPPHKPQNPTAPGAKNPLIIRALTFVPKNLDRTKK